MLWRSTRSRMGVRSRVYAGCLVLGWLLGACSAPSPPDTGARLGEVPTTGDLRPHEGGATRELTHPQVAADSALPSPSEFTSDDEWVRRGARRELFLALQGGADAAERSYHLTLAIAETRDAISARRLLLAALDTDAAMARETATLLLARKDAAPHLAHVIEETLSAHASFASRPAPLLQAETRRTTDPRPCAALLRQMEELPVELATELLAKELDATSGCGALRRKLVLAGLGRLQRRGESGARARELLWAVMQSPQSTSDVVVARAALGDLDATERLASADAVSGLTSLTSSLEPDEALRVAAVHALGRLGTPRARRHLEGMLLRVRDQEAVLTAVADALDALPGGIPAEAANALSPFTSPLERAGFRRRMAALLASAGTGPATQKKLSELSSDADPAIARWAERGLARLADDGR